DRAEDLGVDLLERSVEEIVGGRRLLGGDGHALTPRRESPGKSGGRLTRLAGRRHARARYRVICSRHEWSWRAGAPSLPRRHPRPRAEEDLRLCPIVDPRDKPEDDGQICPTGCWRAAAPRPR